MSRRRLIVFEMVSVDGFFTDEKGDIGWAHNAQDHEWNEFTAQNAKGGGVFLLGRVTYEMMASHWPRPEAAKQNPAVAESMNRNQKIVFSRTLGRPTWQNTRVVAGNLGAEVRRLKEEAGPPLVVMGSGTIVSQLAAEGLVDEFQLVTFPIVLGKGRTLFAGVSRPLALRRTNERSFHNGNLLLCYAPSS
jgi:dihydrofolate reductase